jgi:hypothetical protein
MPPQGSLAQDRRKNMVHNGYRSTLEEQVRKYAPALSEGRMDPLRTKLMVGELLLACIDLVSALADEAVPVDPQDVTKLRWLLERGTLPPDTPPDLADRLAVAEGSLLGRGPTTG